MKPTAADVAAMTRACAELLRARLHLARSSSDSIAQLASYEAPASDHRPRELPDDIRRVAYLIPRVAACLPWRTDCLVQALAARRWLASLGHDSRLYIGSRKQGDRFDAHAWLTWQGQIVTGGDITGFARFVRSESAE